MASPQAAPTRDLVGKKLGRYEVLAQLASGGMATVYVARAQGVAGFERLVAVKVLHPHLAHDDEFISMFLDEARLAARIRHPNVVPTLDISDSAGDGYFLVMEYIEGDHFGALLREAAKGGKRLPPGVSLRIVLDALEGLSAAHQLTDGDGRPLGIVHRDISPHNILLGGDGIARITDFGVAKAEVRLSSTRDGQFKGKLSYMAPEQASSGYADQRSDLFSMAIVAWESLTARRLFRADNNGELLNRVLNAPVPPPSDIDPSLEPLNEVILKALERDPEKRFQSAAEFIEALEVAGAGLVMTGQSGVAGPRQVSKTVREWLGSKIDSEQTRIKAAIDSLGKVEITSPGKLPRPMEASGLTPTPSEVRPARIAPEDATMGAKPSSISSEHAAVAAPPSTPSRAPLWAGAGVVVLLALAGGAWLALGSGSSPPAATPPVATTPVVAPPAVVPAAPVPAEPEVAPPVPVEAAVTAPVEEPDVTPEPTTGRRIRRRGGGSTTAAATTGEATPTTTGTTTTTATTPPSGGSDDDDLLLSNPYRN